MSRAYKVVYKRPLIWPLLKLFFPHLDFYNPQKGMAITIGNTIYVKRFLLDWVLRHELVHVEQQKGSKFYAYFYYIPRYLLDKKFRERMEAEAHAAEKR